MLSNKKHLINCHKNKERKF